MTTWVRGQSHRVAPFSKWQRLGRVSELDLMAMHVGHPWKPCPIHLAARLVSDSVGSSNQDAEGGPRNGSPAWGPGHPGHGGQICSLTAGSIVSGKKASPRGKCKPRRWDGVLNFQAVCTSGRLKCVTVPTSPVLFADPPQNVEAHIGTHMHTHTGPVHSHACAYPHAHTHAEFIAPPIEEQKQLILSFELSSQNGNDPFPSQNSQQHLNISTKDGRLGRGDLRGAASGIA